VGLPKLSIKDEKKKGEEKRKKIQHLALKVEEKKGGGVVGRLISLFFSGPVVQKKEKSDAHKPTT